ncbi:hypothetical protein AAMO2058_001301800, partial [Amorphochlora amoebiformis]
LRLKRALKRKLQQKEQTPTKRQRKPQEEKVVQAPEKSADYTPPSHQTIRSIRLSINRAPVMTLWSVVVCERVGYTYMEALSLGRAVTYMNAQSKLEAMGVVSKATYDGLPTNSPNFQVVGVLGRAVPALKTETGLRGLRFSGDIVWPYAVQKYLENNFSDKLIHVRVAMQVAANRFSVSELTESMGRNAYDLYTKIRPEVPDGVRGLGAQASFDCSALFTLSL